mmetsp:Transcript_18114/g.20894  ORF Transcript_18114/g.20894 Transcript_18114/m.20894 type:complete len:107 (-) Transcript_18114:1866-2186(-)
MARSTSTDRRRSCRLHGLAPQYVSPAPLATPLPPSMPSSVAYSIYVSDASSSQQEETSQPLLPTASSLCIDIESQLPIAGAPPRGNNYSSSPSTAPLSSLPLPHPI